MGSALDELWAKSIKEEEDAKKEKDFQKAIKLIDAKIDLLLHSTADGNTLLNERIIRLDCKIDFLLFSVFGEIDLENKMNQFIEAMTKGCDKNG